MDAAVEVLKKSGAAKAREESKPYRSRRYCKSCKGGGKTAAVVEVNSETDFVAKNEKFQEFVQDVADKALASGLNGGAERRGLWLRTS